MKNLRGFALGIALGLAAAISTVGFAQNTAPKDQKPKSESCCAMESCCCKGDSCSMKNHSKDHSAKDGCCSGDSCNMEMKDKHKEG
jgi:hypothetical protein